MGHSDQPYRKKLNKEGFEPINPGGAEEKNAIKITIQNPGEDDLAKLLEDTAKFIRASEGKAVAGVYESKESLFKRLDIGDFVILAHRS